MKIFDKPWTVPPYVDCRSFDGVDIGREEGLNRMLSSATLAEYLEVAQEAAQRAAVVLQDWRRRFQVRTKGRFDFVTDADMASQQAIRELIGTRFPQHQFVGEEDKSAAARPEADSPPTWIVDPLDGTTNYLHDCPLYCISIGLHVAGELVVGVVLDPSRPELFKAAKGQGAWLGDDRLSTSRVARLEDAMLATGFPSDMRDRDDLYDYWRYFGLRTHALRRTGSTALNLAYVAAGRFDAYYAFDNYAWDVAAGVVLVREAGGTVTNVDGSPFDPFTPDGLFSNGTLHPELLQCFNGQLHE
jgi:myo-inositol-1(or 4)-monophosphatase